MKANKLNFLGYEEPVSFEAAKAVILPSPFDGTTSYGKGTAAGPEAIIDASYHLEWFDIESRKNVGEEIPIFTAEELKLKNDGEHVQDAIAAVKNAYSEIVSSGKFPLMIGGEHSLTVGAIQALKEKYPDLTVVQVDAHSDLRDELDGNQFSHACPMRRIHEMGIKIVQVGIRSMCADEFEYIQKNKNSIKTFYGKQFDVKEVLKACGKNVYFTIDVDGMDPSIMPSTGTPEPEGLTFEQVMEISRQLFKNKNIVGADVMELSPIKGRNAPDFLCAKLVLKMLAHKFLL